MGVRTGRVTPLADDVVQQILGHCELKRVAAQAADYSAADARVELMRLRHPLRLQAGLQRVSSVPTRATRVTE